MVSVKFFGMLRLDIKQSADMLEAGSVDELLRVLAAKYDTVNLSRFRNSIILVNGVNMNELKRYKTLLKTGDEVMFLSSVSGG